jgi:hypothetical protein
VTRWIRSPLWDVALLAFPWLPLYAWFVFGLRLGDGGGEVVVFGQRFSALALATLVVLAITFVHRHYTFVLVYGDPEAYAARARAYLLAPIVAFTVLALAISRWDVPLFDHGPSAWEVVLAISGTWNVWHTIQQRYGILRIYAGKAGGGLESRAQARRDQRMLWSLVLTVALALLFLRRETFFADEAARRMVFRASPILDSTAFAVLGALVALSIAAVVIDWLRGELSASIQPRDRVPRLTFLASTVALFAVFVVHGPIVGYLTFGAAHALEYIAFVHHFGERKFAARPEARSFASQLLRRPMLVAPALVGTLLAAYVLVQPVRDTLTYLVYYTGTSMLHFLYDGWIWKVRKPEVARPLGTTAAST